MFTQFGFYFSIGLAVLAIFCLYPLFFWTIFKSFAGEDEGVSFKEQPGFWFLYPYMVLVMLIIASLSLAALGKIFYTIWTIS